MLSQSKELGRKGAVQTSEIRLTLPISLKTKKKETRKRDSGSSSAIYVMSVRSPFAQQSWLTLPPGDPEPTSR